jgi:dipeptidyl aminopeptidase/acylaminoacyl peptidase
LLLNSRQMGKSSLRVQVMRRLQAAGVRCGVLEVSAIMEHGMTSNEWYFGLVSRLRRGLGVTVQPRPWWREREDLAPIQRFEEFLETVLLAQTDEPIVIFIDEIDSLFAADFSDDFFSMIRACCQHRVDNPAFHRLTFALLGVATPSDLIKDKQRTPFNIGTAINLQGFNLGEVAPLAPGLAAKADDPQAVLKAVLDWTGGQPFLTQKVCQLIVESPFTITAGSEAELVSQLVQNRIITNWEDQDHPEHLTTIRNRLLADEHQAGRLLGLYQHILQRGGIEADDSPEQMTLRLSGLVVKRHGQLQVYNPIYQAVFTESWVEQKLATLRPYTEAIAAWLASGCTDESRLLRGQTLASAQAWAADKSLSDQDRRFLAASQEIENRDVQLKYEAEQDANRILANANRKAGRRLVVSLVLSMGLFIATVAGAWEAAKKEKESKFALIIAEIETAIIQKKAILQPISQSLGEWLLEITKHEIETATQQIETLGEKIAAVNQEVELANQEVELANQEVELAQAAANLAQQERQNAQKAAEDARRATENARQDLAVAELDLNRAQLATRLEQKSSQAMRRFESQQIEGLLLAMEAGSELNKALHSLQEPNISFANNFSQFPTISPVSAVLNILNEIQERNQLVAHDGWVYSVSFSRDGQTLASGGDDGTVRLWSVAEGEEIATLRGHDRWVYSVSFSPDGQTLASGGDDGTVRLWSVAEGQEIATLRGHDRWVQSVSFSPDGQTLASGSLDRTVRLWSVAEGEEIATLRGHDRGVYSVSFSPDGQTLASGSLDRTVRLWSVAEGEEIATLRGHDRWVQSVSFSPDGQTLASGSGDGTVRLWSVAEGEEIATLRGHDGEVSSVSFSRDGQTLASGGDDGTVRLWSVAEGQEIATLRGHDGWVYSVSFSPDGQTLASGSGDGTVRLWPLRLGDWLTLGCNWLEGYFITHPDDLERLPVCQ